MYETHDKKALLLPNVTPADAGKVLAVDENGKLSLEALESELPEVESTDVGKVLTVSNEGEWEAAPIGISGLPEVSVSDAGDVLTVNASGEWEAAAPSGSGLTLYGQYTAILAESATINAGGTGTFQLTKILALDGSEVSYPETEGKCFVAAVLGLSCCLVSFSAPVYVNGQWYNGSITIINTTQQPVTLSTDNPIYVSFYSTVEFEFTPV